MGTKFVSERNLKFLLHEVFDAESLTQHEAFQDQNRKMYDMVLKAAIKFSKDLLYPIFEEMDRGVKKKEQAFYEGKMYTLQYFYAHELPKTMALHKRLTNADSLTLDMQTVHFND